MIRSNLEAELEARKKELEEVKLNIAIVRAIIEMSEDRLVNLNSDYSDLSIAIEDLEEQIEETKEDYED
jgi:chromosome segregation ATPase